MLITPTQIPLGNKEIQRLVQLGGLLRKSQNRKKRCKNQGRRDWNRAFSVSRYLSIYSSLSYTLSSLISCLYLLLMDCWSNSVTFIGSNFMSS